MDREDSSGTCRTVLSRWPSALGITLQAHLSKSFGSAFLHQLTHFSEVHLREKWPPQFSDRARSLPVPSGIGAMR